MFSPVERGVSIIRVSINDDKRKNRRNYRMIVIRKKNEARRMYARLYNRLIFFCRRKRTTKHARFRE